MLHFLVREELAHRIPELLARLREPGWERTIAIGVAGATDPCGSSALTQTDSATRTSAIRTKTITMMRTVHQSQRSCIVAS